MALRLDKGEDIIQHPLTSWGAATNKADVYGGSLIDKQMTHGMLFAPITPKINVPLNYIGRTYIPAPMLGGLEYKPMTPNTSSKKIKDNEILRTQPVKRNFS